VEERYPGILASSDGVGGHRQRTGFTMSWLKSWWKVAAVAVASVFWLVGLADQLESFEMTARYLAISAAMVAVVLT